MSTIDELADLIGSLAGEIDEATALTRGSGQDADETGASAAELGAKGTVQILVEVKAQLDALTGVLRGASERASEIKDLALSAADGS